MTTLLGIDIIEDHELLDAVTRYSVDLEMDVFDVAIREYGTYDYNRGLYTTSARRLALETFILDISANSVEEVQAGMNTHLKNEIVREILRSNLVAIRDNLVDIQALVNSKYIEGYDDRRLKWVRLSDDITTLIAPEELILVSSNYAQSSNGQQFLRYATTRTKDSVVPLIKTITT